MTYNTYKKIVTGFQAVVLSVGVADWTKDEKGWLASLKILGYYTGFVRNSTASHSSHNVVAGEAGEKLYIKQAAKEAINLTHLFPQFNAQFFTYV